MWRFILLLFVPFALIFFEGCAPTLTTLSSHILQPVQPHVVLRNKDTVYARSVVMKERFLTSKTIADDKVFSKGDILYAHTDSGHRYYVIHNRMIEQIVSGRINVYSNGAEDKKQNKKWPINDSGLYVVRISAIGYLQKMPDRVFLKPSYQTIAGLVKDYEPARLQVLKAGRMLDNGTGAIIAGAALSLVGAVTAFAGTLDHKNPNAEILQRIGLGSLAAGCLSLSVALPAFRRQARLRGIMAIETYNRGSL